MPTLQEKPHTNEPTFVETHGRASLLLPISLLIGCMLTIIVASLNYVTKSDEDQLEALQAKIEKREPLEKYEKEAYCDLLWKVKQIRLCACKKNFIKDIGSVTGYDVPLVKR
jgi:type IV pilus biogenesis protein CpaD/CtpE